MLLCSGSDEEKVAAMLTLINPQEQAQDGVSHRDDDLVALLPAMVKMANQTFAEQLAEVLETDIEELCPSDDFTPEDHEEHFKFMIYSECISNDADAAKKDGWMFSVFGYEGILAYEDFTESVL